MKRNALKIMSLMLIIGLCLSMAACGSGKQTSNETKNTTAVETTAAAATQTTEAPKEKVKLRFYCYVGEDSQKKPFDYAAEQMKTIMPEVEIELEPRTDSDMTKLKAYAAVGNLPDIFDSEAAHVATFKPSNSILMLDKYIQEMKVEEQVLPTVKARLYDSDGHCYAMPKDGQHFAMMYYNKKLFADNGVKVPANYDEFLAAVKAFKSKGIVPLALFGKYKWPGVQLFDMLATRYEPAGLTKLDKNQGKIADQAYKYAAEKTVELVKAGLLPKGVFTLDYTPAYEMFTKGQAAMFLNGTWALPDLVKDMGDDVDYLYNPYADAAQTEAAKWNMSGGNAIGGFSASAGTKNPDVTAKYLINFAFQWAKGTIIKTGAVSPLTAEKVEPETPFKALQLKYMNTDMPQFKTTSGFDWTFRNQKFFTLIDDQVAKLMTGEYSVDKFLEDTQKLIDDANK